MADTTTKTITATLGTGYPVRGEKGDKGDSGFSPTAKVTQTDTGATISITDASGTTTADITNGSDAQVTKDNIVNALGYTPAAQAVLEATQGIVGAAIANSSAVPWKAVQSIVRAGDAPIYFPVGAEFNVVTQNYGTLVFTVVAHDHHKNPDDATAHTMTIAMRDVIYARMFDAGELLWANTTDTEIPAGTLHFTGYKNDYPQDTSEDGTYQFTFTKPIPAGGGFWHSTIGAATGSYSVDHVLSGKFYTYDASGNVIESNLSCTLGSGGTDLGTFSVAYGNINALVGKVNSGQRNAYGSNNWKESAVRQWLNGTGTGWWTKQTPFDRKPDYASKLGFLEEVGELAAVLGETEITTSRSTVYEYDGVIEGGYTTRDKMFLLSMTEIGLGNNSIAEGSKLAYYDNATNTDRIKYDYSNKTSACYWWVRSPGYSYANVTRLITTSGTINGEVARYDRGVSPACVIM